MQCKLIVCVSVPINMIFEVIPKLVPYENLFSMACRDKYI